jgi:hypothetical protein
MVVAHVHHVARLPDENWDGAFHYCRSLASIALPAGKKDDATEEVFDVGSETGEGVRGGLVSVSQTIGVWSETCEKVENQNTCVHRESYLRSLASTALRAEG